MLSNVVDVDEAMAGSALPGGRGAALFFDFQVAFPSVAHKFLVKVLSAAGLPAWLLRFVSLLYKNNVCQMVVGGRTHPGFEARAGIRQGCPLSPILFAVAMDILLRRIRRLLPSLTTRAFADDVAAVAPDVDSAAPVLQAIFGEFGRASGLQLNLPKTVMVPLWTLDAAAVQQQFREQHPGWDGIRPETHARYLGFELGPGRARFSFNKPITKLLERAQWWGDAGAGLFLTTTAYSTYVASVIGFLIQLDTLPPQWPDVEAEAFKRLVPGSSQWASPQDLKHLHLFGFARAFADMQVRQHAAKLRVVHWEAVSSGGLNVCRRAAALRELRRQSEEIGMAAAWGAWLDRIFLLQLDDAVREARAQGVTARSIEAELVGDAPRPLTLAQMRKTRRAFQAVAARCLATTRVEDLEPRVRHKLDRWRVPEFPRVRTARGLRFLRSLSSCVPPRVWAATWRALWNGWPTARRTQGRDGLPGCLFDCVEGAPDSIEHYSNCRALHAELESELGMIRRPSPEARLSNFLGLDTTAAEDTEETILKAIRLAAVYRVHCACRHGRLQRGRAAIEAVRQACREVVRGHARAGRAYDAARARLWL